MNKEFISILLENNQRTYRALNKQIERREFTCFKKDIFPLNETEKHFAQKPSVNKETTELNTY